MDLDVFGNLKLLMEERWIVLPEAVAYQYDSGNGIHPLSWTAEYVPNENTGQVGFTFDTYDTSMPLVLLIGPPPMPPTPPGSGVPPCWSTYVAGNGIDAANANGVDADGNSYVAGLTSTVFAEFPGTAAGTNFSATGTAYFTSKFSPQYELLWTSYYGGDGLYQEPWAMAVKNTMAGPEIYVVGQTSNDDQYTVAPPGAYYDSIPALTAQGCIAKYSELGFLTWATYFGNAQTAIHGAAIDGNNNLVITGTSYGGLPVPDVQPAGSTYFGHGVANDAFVAQFDEDDGLRWSTYLPGSVSDHGKSINALENGLVVCGTTNSPNFHLVDPGGAAYFRDTLQGEEVYVALFNASDSLVWSTFVGGSGADATGFCRSALEVDATGNIYLIGTTTSPDLPVDPDGGWSNSTPTNGFIVQFLKNSFGMEWMTYVGDSASRVVPTAIISDEDGNIYMVGETQRYPVTPVELPGMYYQEEPYSTTTDYMQWIGCYIQSFAPDHQLVWSTYFDGVEGWQWPTERINAVVGPGSIVHRRCARQGPAGFIDLFSLVQPRRSGLVRWIVQWAQGCLCRLLVYDTANLGS